MLMKVILVLALILSIIVPLGAFLMGERKAGRLKKSLAVNILSFFSVLIASGVYMFSASAAPEAAGAAAWQYLAAAISTGASSVGAGIAVAAAASSALGAISENDKIMGKALIFVALAEGIALYGLLISFVILSK